MQVTRATARRWLVTALAALALLAACTGDDDPAPEPAPAAPVEEATPSSPVGASVAVVLPSHEELDAEVQEGLQREVERLGEWADDEIREVRAVVADGPAFVSDLAELLAERGTDLVCVLGPSGPRVVEPLVARYRDVRFCSIRVASLTDDGAGEVDRVIEAEERGPSSLVRIRAGELGHAVGVAAAELAGGGAVGLVLGGDEVSSTRFRAGLLGGLTGVEVIEPSGGGSSLERRAERAVADGAEVLVVDGSAGAIEAVRSVDAEVVVLGPMAVTDALEGTAAGERVGLSWRVRWDLALRGPVLELLGEGSVEGALGFADDVFAIEGGPAADDEVVVAVETAIDELVAGERVPFLVVPDDGGAADEPPDADADDGGAADEPPDADADAEELPDADADAEELPEADAAAAGDADERRSSGRDGDG